MATKTKAVLLEEIKTKNEEIDGLKNELKKLEKYKMYADMADELGAIRDSFVNAGFSKSEAFTMLLKTLEMATNPLIMAAIK